MPTKVEIRKAKEQRERRVKTLAKAAVVAVGIATLALVGVALAG